MKATISLQQHSGKHRAPANPLPSAEQHNRTPEIGSPRKRKASALASRTFNGRTVKLQQCGAYAKNLSFLAFMRSWLDDVIFHSVKANTFSQYDIVFTKYIANFPPFSGIPLRALSPALIQSYYNTLLKSGLSPNTVREHHANIHKCLNHALRLGLISSNPSEQTVLPPKRKYTGATALSPDQLKQLLSAFEGDVLEAPVKITVMYGLRRSEVCGLKWDAVDFDADTLSVCRTIVMNNGKAMCSDDTKSLSSKRVLPLTSSMRTYLLNIWQQQKSRMRSDPNYESSGFVCTRSDGKPLNPDFVTHHFQRVLKAAGLPTIRFHDLRHSAVYALRKGGCDAKDIQSWLGHSSVSTTLNVYGHLLKDDLSRLGQVMDSILG